MTKEHSPLPWSAKRGVDGTLNIIDANGQPIIYGHIYDDWLAEGNAELIVEAVNAFSQEPSRLPTYAK